MKATAQKATSRFAGLFGKRPPAPKPKVRAKATKAAADTAPRHHRLGHGFDGPPDLVAAELFWGRGRLWPRDEAGESVLPWQAAEGANIGILGAGLGAWGEIVANRVPTATVSEFDWRSDVSRWRVARAQEMAENTSFIEINLGVLLPPAVRCSCVLAVEPILAQAGTAALRWSRMALEAGGTLILEELTTDTQVPPSRELKNGWMTRPGADSQWLRLDEQESLLRRNGFILGKIKERTGAQLRALQLSLDEAEQRLEPLNEAIKHAPELKIVANHFNCERMSAKNRLKALENGALAVYRIEVIKPRADELI